MISYRKLSKEYIPITFNNPLKVCFFNKKYPITIQTSPTKILKVYFLLKSFFNGFLKIIGAQNQLPIILFSKTLKARNSTPTHTSF